MYIWQNPDWPIWRYQLDELAPSLEQVSRLQGFLYGRLADVGFDVREQTFLSALTEDVVKSSAIEGEVLSPESVRSSIARRLGIEQASLAPVDRHVEGVVDMMLDATSRADEPVVAQRLFGWHAALFPTGYSGLAPITVANWRSDEQGPMQVISGPISAPHRPKTHQQIHYEAPPATVLLREMKLFLDWINQTHPTKPEPALIKAAIGHLWFVTLHPFDDGNGRIGRAIGDLLLARADKNKQRFYSLSAQIQAQRKDYYDVLEGTQKGSMDITAWIHWFLSQLVLALETAHANVDSALVKTKFWQHWAGVSLNPRQIKILNRLLDGFDDFDGNLTTSRWGSMTKCSSDTALRDINQLIDLGIMQHAPGGGRSTSYELTPAHTTQ